MSAFELSDGLLAPLGDFEGGLNPVHVALAPDGASVIFAYYTSGEVMVFGLDPDRGVGERRQVLRLPGEPGPNTAQQHGSHPHHVVFDRTGARVFIADKGLDRVFVCDVDQEGGLLTLASEIKMAPGAGPRHLVFGSSGAVIYVNNELDATVTVLGYDARSGRLVELQTLATLPGGAHGPNLTGEIVFAANHRGLFVSNRGEDNIACFEVDPASELITLTGLAPSGGPCPRFMTLDPSGDHLYVANQDGDSIYRFAVEDGGRLGEGIQVATTGSPACIVFARGATT